MSVPNSTKVRQAASGTGRQWMNWSLPPAEVTEGDERQKHLRAIAGDLMYWKGGLKVLRQAQLPKWRGFFKWQIEAKIEALQIAYAKVRAEVAKPDG